MSLGKGQMGVQVLADGVIRVETGDMGGVAHKAADDFLKELARLMGGDVEVKQVQGVRHTHAHDHGDHHHHEEQ